MEAWGDEFQQKPRRLSWWAFKKDRAPMASYSEGARPVSPWARGQDRRPARGYRGPAERFHRANVSADLSSLRADLDRIDAWIAVG